MTSTPKTNTKLNNSTKNNNTKSSTPITSSSSTSVPPPQPSTSTLTPSTKDLITLLNLPLRLTLLGENGSTTLPRTIEGTLYTYDPTTSILVLTTPSTSSLPSILHTPQNPPTLKRSYHLIKSTQIISIHILSLIPDSTLPSTTDVLKKVNLKELEAKVEKAVREDQKERSRIGVGVTIEGQALFDALGRTLPVRWSGNNIVVMDEVIINFPYSANDVKGAAGKGERVERVKKVLEGERRRLSVV